MTSLAIRDETHNASRYAATARAIWQAMELNDGLSIVAPRGCFPTQHGIA